MNNKGNYNSIGINGRSLKFWVSLFFCLFVSIHAHGQSNPVTPQQQHKSELDKWMLRAYEGDRDAQFKVGVLFTDNQFGQPDLEQAVYWYKQAARQGHVLAQYNLGHSYLTGVGVSKSEQTAIQWWLEAAEQGHSLAQFNVGRAYYLGIGLQEDHTKSRRWFEQAAKKNEPKSIEILQKLDWSDAATAQLTSNKTAEGNQESITSRTTPTTTNETNIHSDVVSPVKDKKSLVETTIAETTQIALYTNPKIKSILITIIKDKDNLDIINKNSEWYTVTSQASFPVWVHGDFLNETTADSGISTGNSVNARSVPIITNGTIVGRLNKGEVVKILDKHDNWYRIIAPARFKVWVKTEDYNQAQTAMTDTVSENSVANIGKPLVIVKPLIIVKPLKTAESSTLERALTNTNQKDSSINDNNWLFKQADSNFTLQLASFDAPVKIREFLSKSKFINNPELHHFTSSAKNIIWTYFLYGSYSTRLAAEQAMQRIGQKKAWIRTFNKLKQNRCIAWKTKLPPPKELNEYCG